MSYSTMRIDQLEKQLAKAEAERDSNHAKLVEAGALASEAMGRAQQAEAERDDAKDALHRAGLAAVQKAADYDRIMAERDALRAEVGEVRAALKRLGHTSLDSYLKAVEEDVRAEVGRLNSMVAGLNGIVQENAQARREERERSAERALDFLPLEHEVGAEAERAHERVHRIAAAIRALEGGAEDDARKYENRIGELSRALGVYREEVIERDRKIQSLMGLLREVPNLTVMHKHPIGKLGDPCPTDCWEIRRRDALGWKPVQGEGAEPPEDR